MNPIGPRLEILSLAVVREESGRFQLGRFEDVRSATVFRSTSLEPSIAPVEWWDLVRIDGDTPVLQGARPRRGRAVCWARTGGARPA